MLQEVHCGSVQLALRHPRREDLGCGGGREIMRKCTAAASSRPSALLVQRNWGIREREIEEG